MPMVLLDSGAWMLIALLLYLAPTLIALTRDHPQVGAIFVLNLLLGWTFLGWVGALVWSMTAVEEKEGSAASCLCALALLLSGPAAQAQDSIECVDAERLCEAAELLENAKGKICAASDGMCKTAPSACQNFIPLCTSITSDTATYKQLCRRTRVACAME